MYSVILAFITAFLLTYWAIPSIISIAEKKNLVDEPGERRAHTRSTPSLGGIAIFAGIIFSIIMWTPFKYFGDLQYILCAFIILFLIGVKDDIDPVLPYQKFGAEIISALILVFIANIRITSLYGIFGINELPYVASILLSIFTILVIINSFNLIDGVNGLSGSIAGIIASVFGLWFYQIDMVELSILAFAMVGAIVGFLKYNFSPAKIFMGDTGSLLLGLICAILAIQFIEMHKVIEDVTYATQAAPAVAVGILIVPLFDTLRVFTLRMMRGRSPFSPDRNHMHHLLLDSGLTHMQTTATLVMFNLGVLLLVYKLQFLGSLILLLILLAIALIFVGIIFMASRRSKVRQS